MSESNLKKVKVGVLTSYTINNLKKSLIDNLKRRGFDSEVIFGDYNQYVQELISPDSFLIEEKVDVVFLALSFRSLFPNLYYEIGGKRVYEKCLSKVRDVVDAINSSNVKAKFIVSTIDYPIDSPKGFSDIAEEDSIYRIVSDCNQELIKFSRENSKVVLLDFDRVLSRVGKDRVTDEKMYYLGKILLNSNAVNVLSNEIATIVNSVYGKIKKCIVVDLDNTLWGGIIGEDGVNGIKLGDSNVGDIYSEVQKILKVYKENGTILAICSKNNLNDVLPVFDRKEMILKEDDFIVKKINWNAKSQNIMEIAKEINIGLDSLIFLDDNPVERLEVSEALPMVEVIDFPKDVADLPKILRDVDSLKRIKITEEDKKKHVMYSQENERKELEKTTSLSDYLHKLGIEIEVKLNDLSSLERITQLINKTNQFNLRTQRYTREEVEVFINSKDWIVASVSVCDKFGELGLTGVILIEKRNEGYFVDSFLMSCRVLSRDIEIVFFREVVKNLKGVLRAEYIESLKNSQVKEFYEKLGMKSVLDEGNVKKYEVNLDEFDVKAVDWIKVL